MAPTGVFHYPDNDKYGIVANGVPFREIASDGLPRFAKWVRADINVDYWEGEVKTPGSDG